MRKSKTQGSLEYVIIIGGVIILAAATYFMLRGFSQTTGAGTTEQIGVAGEKYMLELENLGRSETKFSARKWANPILQKRTLMEFSSLGDVTFNTTNLTDHGILLSSLEFDCFGTGFCELNHTIAGDILTVHTAGTCCTQDFDLYMFYNNFTALINPCLANYTGPPRISCGTIPLPDSSPPSINISSTAFGSSGSVKDAVINVTVNGTGSNVSEAYYRIDDSAWFPVNNLYYGQGGITAEAHPVDGKYDDEFETIHIIATVPEEANYTISVLARDEYGNEVTEEEEVSLSISESISLLSVFSTGDSERNVSFLSGGSGGSAKIELPLDAIAESTSLNVAGLEILSEFGFLEKEDYQTGEEPREVHAGDFNNDGGLDAVVVNWVGNSFSYFNGSGNGLFQSKVDYPNGGRIYEIVTGDFDNDGDLDVVTANGDTDDVSYFENNGDGTFVNTANYTTGDGPESISAGDFDKDGNLDVVTGNLGAATFSYLEGNGDGTFQSKVDHDPGYDAFRVCNGDFDNDGNLDVVLADDVSGFTYTPGNGNGTFNSSVWYSTNGVPVELVAGDFNRDGDLDLVLFPASGGTYPEFTYLGGNGDGTFQAAQTYWTGGAVSYMHAYSGDFNKDGNLDVVTNNFFADTFSYFPGNGDGTFNNTVNYTGIQGGISAGDFDNDGDLDVVVTDSSSDTFSYFESNADLIYSFEGFIYAANHSPGGGGYLNTGDFNKDGEVDVLIMNGAALSYFEGNGDGTFQLEVNSTTGGYPQSLFTGDFDNDGDLDAVTHYWDLDQFSYFAGNGDGTFQSAVNYTTGDGPKDIHAGDIDNDGDLDVVVANFLDESFSYFENEGNATFQDAVNIPAGERARSIFTGDFNNDGNLDVITANYGTPDFSFFAGNGNGTFQTRTEHASLTGYTGKIRAGDFDNDGDLDITVLEWGEGADGFLYIAGNGNGTFVNLAKYLVIDVSYSEPTDIFVGDFDEDGNLDVVAAGVWNSEDDRIAYFAGNGNGTFQGRVDYILGEMYGMIGAGDFDNDGDIDMIVANVNPYAFAYFANNRTLVNESYYCTNASLDIGSDGSTEWSYSGDFNVSEVLSGAGFVTELNSFLPACSCPGCSSSGGGTKCTITFNFSSDTPGILQLSGLAIQYARSG